MTSLDQKFASIIGDDVFPALQEAWKEKDISPMDRVLLERFRKRDNPLQMLVLEVNTLDLEGNRLETDLKLYADGVATQTYTNPLPGILQQIATTGEYRLSSLQERRGRRIYETLQVACAKQAFMQASENYSIDNETVHRAYVDAIDQAREDLLQSICYDLGDLKKTMGIDRLLEQLHRTFSVFMEIMIECPPEEEIVIDTIKTRVGRYRDLKKYKDAVISEAQRGEYVFDIKPGIRVLG